ncbi:MAG: tetratricopeptide repeat protein [Rubrivivax sp.]|nr:MAG: tetratricopeptide repeat protein [Rubrivivax sp.]
MHLRPFALLVDASRFPSRRSLAIAAAFVVSAAFTGPNLALAAPAQVAPKPPPPVPTPPDLIPTVENSALDATLFYQLLISEVQARSGDLGTAYQLYLDAARRMRNSQLFQRSVDIALQARAGEQALSAAQSWRQTLPADRAAAEYTAQILMALGRTGELAEPLISLIEASPAPQRPQVIATLPRSLNRIPDRKAAAELIDKITLRWREPAPGMAEAWAASSEGWLSAGDQGKALQALDRARAVNPSLLTVGLLALDLMGQRPETEAIVKAQLADKPVPLLRLAYARKLATTSRLPEAGEQLDAIVKEQPDNATAWLTLGAVRFELRQLDAAEKAVARFLALQEAATAAQAQPASGAATTAPVPSALALDPDQGYLLMAQISELRQQPRQADEWLRKADPDGQKIKVQAARAKLMAQNGQLRQARALLRALPESEPRDALDKINAEAQLLREAKRVDEAYQLLEEASKRFTDDADLLYDQAMLGEKLKRFDDSERLLRRVIAIKADHPHAYNALGYSLADRGLRLDEARGLINKALEMRPGDPFITDSLGWLEFRAGRTEEAIKWLRQAYVTKADAEIAAHLGEVLWSAGQRDEALRIWREGAKQDIGNETLWETLKRLKVEL